jgi:hypothetical protein
MAYSKAECYRVRRNEHIRDYQTPKQENSISENVSNIRYAERLNLKADHTQHSNYNLSLFFYRQTEHVLGCRH